MSRTQSVYWDYRCNDTFSKKLHIELVDNQNSARYRNLGVRASLVTKLCVDLVDDQNSECYWILRCKFLFSNEGYVWYRSVTSTHSVTGFIRQVT
jgi:hypothetical protein